MKRAVYESAVAITGPLKTIKIAKIDLKKVSKQKIIFVHLSHYNGPTFYGKNISLHNPFKSRIFNVDFRDIGVGPFSVKRTLQIKDID